MPRTLANRITRLERRIDWRDRALDGIIEAFGRAVLYLLERELKKPGARSETFTTSDFKNEACRFMAKRAKPLAPGKRRR